MVIAVSAGCDQLLMEPAAAPMGSIALSLAPSAPNFAVAPASANRVRVQVYDEGEILLDTTFAFNPEAEELLVPVRFTGSQRFVAIGVEIAEDGRPLLHGSTSVRLQQRRVTDAEISLEGAEVFPLTSVFDLTTGVYHSCADAGLNGLFCWGNNDEGQLGTGKFAPSPIALLIAGTQGMYGISAGFLTTCGLAFEGAAFCWGDNEFGSLGSGSSPARSALPVPVSTEESFSMLSVNGLHACGLSFEGQAFCWGFNGFGQLGDGTTTNRFTPVPVASGIRFQSISAGYVHTCGVSTQGQTYCWGLNEFGQIGDGTETDRLVPSLVGGQQLFQEVSAGGLHTCGRTRGGATFCWGFNDYGQLGNGSTDGRNVPEPVGTTAYAELSAGGLHTCGVDVDGNALCWGYNGSGALGNDSEENSATPVLVTGGESFGVVRAGLHHSCGVTEELRVLCWGYNRFGQLGDGSHFDRTEPDAVLYGEPFFEEQPVNSGEQNNAVAALLTGRLIP
jgi:alpha-tubulin suppressor-like RCC1 family protein